MPQTGEGEDDAAMRMRRILAVVGLLTGLLGGWLMPANAAANGFTTLDPGRAPRLTEEIPVQIVMLGYEQDVVPVEWFREYLTNYARPSDRARTYRTIENYFGHSNWTWADVPRSLVHELGLHYSFDHSVTYADAAYEDRFFDYLLTIGVNESDFTGADVSLMQFLYNQQPSRKFDITDNLVIDPAKVERWLLDNPAPGVDPSRNTVVFVNWWGRDDFRFHEYEVAGEAQSETGVNFAKKLWTTRMIAWGGTGAHDEESSHGRPSRTWFHDLSAGPDWRTGGWVLDDNFGGFGPDPNWQVAFPPVWEYALGGAQDRWLLPDALGTIARFVAINLFFAASPLYGTDTDAQMSDDVELDVTVYGDVALTPRILREELGDLLGNDPRLELTPAPYAGTPAQCHQNFLDLARCRPETDPSTYPVDANFFGSAERELPKWRDRSAGYEAPGFVYQADRVRRWIAFADENWTDGSRTATHTMLGPTTFARGNGTTTTMVHEYGHHFGVSHSHDGYETEWGPNGYSANNPLYGVFYFTWVGNEVSSVMSYLDVEGDFSQFDVDNYQRWQAIRHLRAANLIAGDVVKSARASAASAHLSRADASFTAAQAALDAHDYPRVASLAAEGYRHARAAAAAAKVAIPRVDPFAMAAPGSWRGTSPKQHFGPASEPVEDHSAMVPGDLLARFGNTARR